MSAQEIIEEIKHLPADERARVTKFFVELDGSRTDNGVRPVTQPDFLARAKKIWGETPEGKPLCELVSDARGG